MTDGRELLPDAWGGPHARLQLHPGSDVQRLHGRDRREAGLFALSGDSRLGQRNRRSLTVQAFDGHVDGFVECGDVGERLVGEIMGLEAMPNHFDVVQFRGVFGQPLDSVPGRPALRARAC